MSAAVSTGIEEIYGQARRQATRIRMKALEDAVQMADRVTELAKLRDDLGSRVTELADAARARLGAEEAVVAPASERYAGEVEVEIGPFRDFAQLTGFEDAAAGVASEIRVKRFADRRATLSMRLDDPVELLRELEERAPFDFVVRDTRRDQLVLDIDEGRRHQQDQQDRRAA